MPKVFYSPVPGAPREIMSLSKGDILYFRDQMYALEAELQKVAPAGDLPVNEISLSGSFPVNEIRNMIDQNIKTMTHLSFLTGFDKDRGHFTLLVPMKDVIPADPSSGSIIDEDVTIYSAICCAHPPLLNE